MAWIAFVKFLLFFGGFSYFLKLVGRALLLLVVRYIIELSNNSSLFRNNRFSMLSKMLCSRTMLKNLSNVFSEYAKILHVFSYSKHVANFVSPISEEGRVLYWSLKQEIYYWMIMFFNIWLFSKCMIYLSRNFAHFKKFYGISKNPY